MLIKLPPAADSPTPGKRLVSLDQFRGYTVVGMFLVNYFGGYAVCPQVLIHTHDYCSYADTIMPHFLFAVGFALRLTFGRRVEAQGTAAAYGRMVRRLLGLILVSLVVYTVGPRAETWEQLKQLGVWGAIAEPLKRSWFQTLMHIAVTSLWVLPVLRSSTATRIAWMIGSGLAHIGLSYWFAFTWVNTSPNGIDGGPLGFLTWCIPTIVGTLACDIFIRPREQLQLFSPTLFKVAMASFAMMAFAWVISCGTRLYDVPASQVEALRSEKLAPDPVWPAAERFEAKRGQGWEAWLAEPPFVKPPDATQRKWNYWMMSQRAGTLAYPTFAAGFSLLVYLLFFIACDLYGWQLAFFRTFGTNALLGYVLHGMVGSAVKPFFPEDSPAWYALSGLFLFFLVTWVIVRNFEKQNIFLRV